MKVFEGLFLPSKGQRSKQAVKEARVLTIIEGVDPRYNPFSNADPSMVEATCTKDARERSAATQEELTKFTTKTGVYFTPEDRQVAAALGESLPLT